MADPATSLDPQEAQLDPSAALAPAISPWAAALALLQHPAAVVAVLLSGALLAWLGSQWPQSRAPLLAADGLARLDLIALAELGFDRVLSSLPLLLWLIAAVAVALVRWRAAATPLAMAGQAFWATSAVAAAAAMWAAPATQTVLVDLPVEMGAAPVQAWSPDAGRLAPAAGSWAGQCTLSGATGQQLACKLEGQGRSWVLDLAPGRPSRQDGFQWTWISSGPALGSRVWDASWPTAAGPAALVRLQADRAVDVPPLATRLVPVATRAAGPMVLALPSQGEAKLWSAAPLAPKAAPTAQIRTAPMVRLQLAPVSAATWMWLLAWAAAAAAIVASPSVSRQRRPS